MTDDEPLSRISSIPVTRNRNTLKDYQIVYEGDKPLEADKVYSDLAQVIADSGVLPAISERELSPTKNDPAQPEWIETLYGLLEKSKIRLVRSKNGNYLSVILDISENLDDVHAAPEARLLLGKDGVGVNLKTDIAYRMGLGNDLKAIAIKTEELRHTLDKGDTLEMINNIQTWEYKDLIELASRRAEILAKDPGVQQVDLEIKELRPWFMASPDEFGDEHKMLIEKREKIIDEVANGILADTDRKVLDDYKDLLDKMTKPNSTLSGKPLNSLLSSAGVASVKPKTISVDNSNKVPRTSKIRGKFRKIIGMTQEDAENKKSSGSPKKAGSTT